MSKYVWQLPKFSDTPKLVRVFLDTDLRNGQDGLSEIAKKANHDPRDLKPGEFIFFVNHQNTAVKGFASSIEAMVYWKIPGNHRIPLDALQYIPKYFGATEFPLRAALKEYVESRRKRK